MSSNKESSRDIAIKLENISKSFQIYDKPHHRLMQGLFRGKKHFFREFHALHEISFEIKRGETVGIIGRNGAGKSTLLQIICGTLAQTSGSVEINGRIAALLELGAGFNTEFTGRENVYMNGAILGFSTKEIDCRFDDIAAFADIGDYLDQPVKTYSSGMFVRLAFAVNIMSEPEIMIVDEALAVGDMNFQAKCMTALTRIQENGATVLFVSHDIGSVKSLCSRGVYLEQGGIKSIGTASDIAELYTRTMREEMNEECRQFVRVGSTLSTEDKGKRGAACNSLDNDKPFKRSKEFDKRVAAFRYGSGEAKITYVELIDDNNAPLSSIDFNQQVKIRIYLEIISDAIISVNFQILDDKKINLTGCGFKQAGQDLLNVNAGDLYQIEYSLKLPLQEGNYSIRAHISTPAIDNSSAKFIDVVDDAVVFNVNRWEQGRVWSKVYLFPALHWQKSGIKD